jgi:O-antigen/teichoic acid export membrane protein
MNETNNSKNSSLHKVAKGSIIVYIGSLLSALLIFFGRLIIIRYWSQSDYGVFSLALVIMTIISFIATLGMKEGAIRSIAYTRGKKDYERIPELISSSVVLSIIASILLGVFVYLLSGFIAIDIFNDSALIDPLKVFAIGIPFLTLIDILVSLFRGFNQVKPTVYFHYILINLLFPIFLFIVIIFDKSVINIYYSYIASSIVVSISLLIYVYKYTTPSKVFSVKSALGPTARKLVSFSLPLLGSSMLFMLVIWTDTLLLGVFRSSSEVGLYNAATPLAQFLSFPLISIGLIYMPVLSELYARGKMDEIRRNYSILTKWLSLTIFPFFLILFLFADTIVTFLFGQEYLFSANALRILSLGYMIHNLAGQNTSTLIGIGENQFIMYSSLVVATVNIVLNIILIPLMGIEGAAIATAIALFSTNIIKCLKIYSKIGASPMSRNLIIPSIISIGIILIFYIILKDLITINFYIVILFLLFYYLVFSVILLLTRSLDKEDLDLLNSIEQKAGVRIKFIEKIFLKFSKK